MREHEYKFIVRRDELDFLENNIYMGADKPAPQCCAQINYYYDTEDYSLDSAGAACRIRKKDGRLSGTLKLHGKSTCGGNTELPFNAGCISDSIKLGETELFLMGALYTDRRVYVLSDGLKLMFDTNKYLGDEDCELEIEFTEKTKSEADAIVKETELLLLQYCMMCGYDSSFYNTPLSKSERFFKRKRKMQLPKAAVNINFSPVTPEDHAS